jgi:hypothetical protein
VVVYAAREDPDPNILTFLVVLAFPLVLIWFSDALGSFRGYVGKGGYIDKETPGCLVAATGWIFLGVITLSVLFGVP